MVSGLQVATKILQCFLGAELGEQLCPLHLNKYSLEVVFLSPKFNKVSLGTQLTQLAI